MTPPIGNTVARKYSMLTVATHHSDVVEVKLVPKPPRASTKRANRTFQAAVHQVTTLDAALASQIDTV